MPDENDALAAMPQNGDVSPPKSVHYMVPTPKLISKDNNISSNLLSMTFDDCPLGNTGDILDILKKYGMRATFFVLGSYAEKHPDDLKRMVEEGHTVANHTFDHKMITKLTPEQLKWEIKSTENIIFDITGERTILFRPPYGFINNEQISMVSGMGYSTVLWSVDTHDYVSAVKSISAARKAGPGDIVLFHTKSSTGKSIEAICKYYSEHGLKSVPVEELIAQTYSDFGGESSVSDEYMPDSR